MTVKRVETAHQRKRQASRECRRATLFLFALSLSLWTFTERMAGPLPLPAYLVYVGFWSVLLLPLVLLHFHGARWRLGFYLLFFLCFGAIAAAPHPADAVLRDFARIGTGMPVEEAHSLLAPYIRDGDLLLASHPERLTETDTLLCYEAPGFASIDWVYVSIKRGHVDGVTVGWEWW